MEKDLRRLIVVKTQSKEEELQIGEKIHNQLIGNQDYIDCRIVLNLSSDRDDGTENEVRLYIFNDSISDPEITI